MAFNPFHSFRKHQKVIFAVLTIICMFVFVLQFGRNDFLERLANLFGGGKQKGEPVATLYGSKVYPRELLLLRQERQMASEFIIALMFNAIQQVREEASARGEKVDRRLNEVLMNIKPFNSQNRFQTLSRDIGTVQQMKLELKDKEGKDEERLLVEDVEAALKVEMKLMALRGGYFGLPRTNDDLLDFLIWKHEADKLGMVLNDDAVRQLLKRDLMGLTLLPEGAFKTNEKLRLGLSAFNQRYGKYTEEDILSALKTEYRVVMAQEALLGRALTYQQQSGLFDLFAGITHVEQMPVTVTTAGFLDYFRAQRTTVKAALLPLPVDDFEKQLKEKEPSEADLVDFYAKYKSFEPKPDLARPGFKRPREVRVQYYGASYKDEFYQNIAKKRIASSALTQVNLAIAQQVLAGASAFPAGGGAGAWSMTAGQPLADDPVLLQYNRYCEEQQKGTKTGLSVPQDTYDASYDAASALGQILGGLAAGNPVAAPAAITGTSRGHDQLRARGAGAAILAGTSPTPVSVFALYSATNTVQPLDKIGSYLVDESRANLAKTMLLANFVVFSTELGKLRGKPTEEKVYVEKAAKEYGFKLKTMPTPKNDQQISDDPELKELREAFAKRTPVAITKPAEFASEVMRAQMVYQPDVIFLPRNPQPPTMLSDEVYEYWLVEDDPAKERKFADAKPDVLEAWRRMQARVLARKEAKRIETEANGKEWPTDAANRQREVEAWLNEQKYGKAFVLDKVARQIPVDTPNPGISKEYKAYEPPEADIKYPPANFTDRLVDLRKPGNAIYLEDRPESVVYVVVLLARTEPTEEEFERAYQDARDKKDPLWGRYMDKERETFVTKLLDKMREDASPGQTENGKWKLGDGSGGRNSMPSPEDF